MAHLEKFSSSFVIRLNFPVLAIFVPLIVGLLLPIWCLSTLANYYFKVSFDLKVTFYISKNRYRIHNKVTKVTTLVTFGFSNHEFQSLLSRDCNFWGDVTFVTLRYFSSNTKSTLKLHAMVGPVQNKLIPLLKHTMLRRRHAIEVSTAEKNCSDACKKDFINLTYCYLDRDPL